MPTVCLVALASIAFSRATYHSIDTRAFPTFPSLLVAIHPSISSLQTIMSAEPSTSTSISNFASIFNAALETYQHKTKKDLASHPLLPSFQSCDSPEAVLAVLREQIPAFGQSQNDDDGFTKWVTPTVKVLYSFSDTLGQGVGLVNITIFPPEEPLLNIYFQAFPAANAIFAGIGVLLLVRIFHVFPPRPYFDMHGSQAANNTSASQDKLVELFNRIERFFGRLVIYTGIKPTTAMRAIIVDIMVEVLTILGIATKEVKRGRMSELISH